MDVPIVIDNGTYYVKVGFTNCELPTLVPCFLAKPFLHSFTNEKGQFKTLYGGEAISQHQTHSLSPISPSDEEEWGNLLEHIYNDILKTSSTKHPVLITEPPFQSQSNRQLISQVLFERFEVPSICFASSPLLSLYATGSLNGLVVDVGHSSSSTVPVLEGQVFGDGIQQVSLGGQTVLKKFINLINTKLSTPLSNHRQCLLASQILHRVGYVASSSLSVPLACTYILPDGQSIVLERERTDPINVLFDPLSFRVDSFGIVDATLNTLNLCQTESRALLQKNIVITGGSSLFKGFAGRFVAELKARLPSFANIRVVNARDRHLLAFNGGRVLSSLACFGSMSVSRAEFEENPLIDKVVG
ncbi:hypothetical protein P9112_000169 [Eukaryota sp. TZLM1-RC]